MRTGLWPPKLFTCRPVNLCGLLPCCSGGFTVLFTMFKPSRIYACFQSVVYDLLSGRTIYLQENHSQHRPGFREAADPLRPSPSTSLGAARLTSDISLAASLTGIFSLQITSKSRCQPTKTWLRQSVRAASEASCKDASLDNRLGLSSTLCLLSHATHC